MLTPFRRRAGSTGLPQALWLSLCLGLLPALLSGAEAGRVEFVLPAAAAEVSLETFAEQAAAQVVYLLDDVRGVVTQPVAGTFAPGEALARLLAGTVLKAERDGGTGALVVSRERFPRASANAATSATIPSEQPMKLRPPSRTLTRWLALVIAPLSAAAAAAAEPSGGTATITGRIFHPAAGEFLRNAEVRVVGGPSVTSGEGGVYRISGLAPGNVSLLVSFTGFQSATATVRLAGGETVTRDFELRTALKEEGDGTVKLGAFVVSSQREGNAKAIMEQRSSMNITNSVSADALGDVAEGNVGEFLKHLPGVDYDSLDGTVRYVSLRGLGTEYAGVTVDGMNYPSANAEGVSRGFSFEQVSLSAMESVEVSKTVSADVDASSPAGTVNLKTKRAFDREGRRVSASLSLTGHSEHLTLGRSFGPGDDRQRKILPSAQFEYSDIFLNRRLGVVFGVSESNSYIQRAPTTMTYNYTPTAASPEPMALTAINAQQIIQTVERFAASLSADYKATPHLVLSLGVMYNHSDVWSGQRTVNFNTGTRASAAALGGGDPLTRFTTTANGTVTVTPLAIAKVGNGKSYSPRFTYTRGDLMVEGRFGLSDSVSAYNPMKYRDSMYTTGGLALAGVRFNAERSALNSGDWRVTQTAGGDWNNGALYSAPLLTREDGRFAVNELQTAEGIVTLRTHRILPVVWKAGAKWKQETRLYANRREGSNYAYIGPGAGVGQWRDYRSPLVLDYSAQGMHHTSITGAGVFLPDLMQIARTFRARPQDFESRLTATNFYNAAIANERDFDESITAFYLMGTTRIGAFNVRAGLRREDTETDAMEFDVRSSSEVRAAGYAVAGGRATTIPGLQYQYLSRPKTHRTGSYDNLFPSAAVKYNLTRQLDLQVGFSRTIRRPSVTSLAGVWTVDDDLLTVNAPNVNLKPEYSDNFSVRLARYFEPIGVMAVNFFQNDIEGLHQTGTRIGSEEFAPGETLYDGYTFITTTQSQDDVRVRGMELEYSQSLSFLPRPFSGFGVRANYTRNYAQVTVANMSPHLVSAGLNYAHRRGQLYANMNWASSRPINAANTQYQRNRINVDVGGSFRVTRQVLAFFSVRNVLNEPFIRMQKVGDTPAAALFYQKFGVTPTVGVRATF
jgi:iron complex outermembrane receptor protein